MIMRSIVHMTDAARSGIMPPAQLTTINQSQLSAQLGLNLGGASVPHTSPSPPASKSATPSPSSSINEEDADETNRVSQRWPRMEPRGQLSLVPANITDHIYGTIFFFMDLEKPFNGWWFRFWGLLLFFFTQFLGKGSWNRSWETRSPRAVRQIS